MDGLIKLLREASEDSGVRGIVSTIDPCGPTEVKISTKDAERALAIFADPKCAELDQLRERVEKLTAEVRALKIPYDDRERLRRQNGELALLVLHLREENGALEDEIARLRSEHDDDGRRHTFVDVGGDHG